MICFPGVKGTGVTLILVKLQVMSNSVMINKPDEVLLLRVIDDVSDCEMKV